MADPDIDFLLARGALSGPQREEALERILDRVAPRKKTSRRRWAVVGALAAAMVAATILVMLVARSKPHAMDDAFAARGTSAAGMRVEIACTGAKLDACPLGSRLLFTASGGTRPGYLAAYAEPVSGGGERVWYFSGEGDAPTIAAGTGPSAPLEAAVEIGPEHRVGRYLVHVIVAARPLSREEALRPGGDSLLSETIPLAIVR
jgi:hypothetical protein